METEIFPTKSYSEIKKGLPASTLKATGGAYDGGSENYIKDEGTVERMEDALNKKVEDAINPAHYKVEGLPEAIDIINHLMHREQLEGFYWGNIIKYAYRYGRKGDKAETAGKIAWYATKLKELEECESK